LLRLTQGVAIRAGQGGEYLRQIMPQPFYECRQVPVIEREPAKVLDDAQTLAGPVGRGIEDAEDGMFVSH
jgi:hypothetical protein